MAPVVHNGAVMRSQLYSFLLGAYFPTNVRRTTDIEQVQYFFLNSSNMLERPGTRDDKFMISEKALSAMSCISLGRFNRDYRMTRYGVQLHRATTHHISKLMVQDPYNEDYMRAMVILKILEGHHYPHGCDNWAPEMKESNPLLRQTYAYNGPPRSSLMRAVYHQQKQAVIYSLTSVDFTREEFQYLIDSKTGHPIDGLFEIFVDLGSLITLIEQADHSDRTLCQGLLSQCRALKETAMTWYSSNLAVIGGPPFIRDESNQHILPPVDDLFGSPYSFVSLDNARIHMFFWTSQAVLHSLIYQAEVLVLAHTRSTFAVDPTTHADFLLAGFYADQFCRSIPFFLQGQVELWGMVAVLVSMPHMLKVYIHLRSRDNFFWCLQFCSFLSMMGIEMATYVSEAWKKTWYLAEDPSVNSMLSLSLRYGLSKEIRASSVSTSGKVTEIVDLDEEGWNQNIAPT